MLKNYNVRDYPNFLHINLLEIFKKKRIPTFARGGTRNHNLRITSYSVVIYLPQIKRFGTIFQHFKQKKKAKQTTSISRRIKKKFTSFLQWLVSTQNHQSTDGPCVPFLLNLVTQTLPFHQYGH